VQQIIANNRAGGWRKLKAEDYGVTRARPGRRWRPLIPRARDGAVQATPADAFRGEGMLKDYANTLILGVIAVLLLVIVLQQGSLLDATRATDEGVADMRDQLSNIRGYVCVQANPDDAACWAHQDPGAQ